MSPAVRDAELIHLRQVRLAAERLVRALERHFSRRDIEPEAESIYGHYSLLAKILAEGRPSDSTELRA